jgi:hypothetical protein
MMGRMGRRLGSRQAAGKPAFFPARTKALIAFPSHNDKL